MVLVLNPRGRRANAWIFWPQLKTEYPEISDYICFKHKLPQITFPYTEMCADVLLSGSWVLIMLILMGFWSSDTYLCIAFVTILHKRVPVWYPGQGAVSRHMKQSALPCSFSGTMWANYQGSQLIEFRFSLYHMECPELPYHLDLEGSGGISHHSFSKSGLSTLTLLQILKPLPPFFRQTCSLQRIFHGMESVFYNSISVKQIAVIIRFVINRCCLAR